MGERQRTRTYINRDKDIQSVMRSPFLGLLVVFFCRVVSDNKRVFGQFFEKAFGCCAVDVEV